jgi:hypothetical protein
MSGLDAIIDAEVNQNTRSYYIIQEYLKRVPVSTIIEIGASSGGGTTEALIKGVLNSPSKGNGVRMASVEVSRARFKNLKERYQDIPFFTPYNTSSVPLDKFPSDDDVRFFMKTTNVHGGNVTEVLKWLRQDIKYVTDNGFNENGIQKIKDDFNVKSFSFACIDGSEFTGEPEYNELPNCDAYFLDDIHVIKNWVPHRTLEKDTNYVKLFQEDIRGGSSLFCKKEIATKYFSN